MVCANVGVIFCSEGAFVSISSPYSPWLVWQQSPSGSFAAISTSFFLVAGVGGVDEAHKCLC